MIKHTTAVYKDERTWFFIMTACLILVSTLYTYFVLSSVVHVVMRKEIDREIREVSSVVSNLETAYIDAVHAVEVGVPLMGNYVAVEDKIFIDRTPDTVALSTQQ